MKIRLETPRLILREFTEADAAELFALDSDPEVMRYIGPYQLPDVEAYRSRIRTLNIPYYMATSGIRRLGGPGEIGRGVPGLVPAAAGPGLPLRGGGGFPGDGRGAGLPLPASGVGQGLRDGGVARPGS